MKKILSSLLILSMTALWGAEPIALPVLEAPALIDGALSEACWEKALQTGEFKNLKAEPVKEKTEGFLFIDKENFYIGLKCHFANYEAKQKEISAAGNDPFSIDAAEIFIDPGATGNYNHIAINAASMLYFPVRQGQIQYGIQINSDHWSLEAKIPFAALKISGNKFRDYWRVNLARRNVGIAESTIWADLKNGTLPAVEQFVPISGIGIDLLQLGAKQAASHIGEFEISLDHVLYDSQKELNAVLDIKYEQSMKGFCLRSDIRAPNGESIVAKTIKPVFFQERIFSANNGVGEWPLQVVFATLRCRRQTDKGG